jgi:hypothetical protein
MQRATLKRPSPQRALHLACAPLLALSVMGAEKAETTCSVSGLAETDAELTLTRVAGRIESFSYNMSRPVNQSWHECSIDARRDDPDSVWFDGKGRTVVLTKPEHSSRRYTMEFTPRPNGVRMSFLNHTHCSTFRLPPVVEFRWSKQGCKGRAIGWIGGRSVGSFSVQQ